MIKQISGLVAGLLLVSVLKFGWNVINAEDVDLDDPQTETEWILEDDQWVSEDLASGRSANALGWFQRAGHATFEGDRQAPATST